MSLPARTFQIEFTNRGGTRTLQYGFRAAWHLKLRPLNIQDLVNFLGDNLELMDAEAGAKFVQACCLWEHAEGERLADTDPPTVDWLIDHLDGESFRKMFDDLLESMRPAKDTNSAKSTDEPAPDPPQA